MPSPVRYPRVASFRTAEAFMAHLASAGITLPFDHTLEPPDRSPLAEPVTIGARQLSNRFAILPMEGWDGGTDGTPSALTERRWQHFGASGASLIWGGEAVAVRHDGRANPHQLMLTHQTAAAVGSLVATLKRAHADRYGQRSADRLSLGLQLTHSGRFSKPDVGTDSVPAVAYHHPWLDRRSASVHVLSDEELDSLCDDFVDRARLARELGFDFVDIKHCHGYLGHELLSARYREGRYGGPLTHRLRFLGNIVHGIHRVAPGLEVGVRLSAFDTPPYRPGATGIGTAEVDAAAPYDLAFGRVRDDDMDATLADAREALAAMRNMGIKLVCITGGSPYYCPHILRPALFPPSDGYLPPEDPLTGVARHVRATALLKAVFPDLLMVGSGYTYLQEWLPHVAQRVVRDGGADLIGLGRMVLAYPTFPADVLAGRPLERRAICRTFSDCTSGPRNGLVSGCFPLDEFYTSHPDYQALQRAKQS